YLIYRNWTPIKQFFTEIWSRVTNVFHAGINSIKSMIQSVDSVFANNPLLTFLFPLIGIPRLIIANWSSIRTFFADLWMSLQLGASEAWNSINLLFAPIGLWFSERWAQIKTGASDAWGFVSQNAASAWNAISTVFAPVGMWFSARWAEIKAVFSGGISGLSALILNWSPIGLFYAAFARVMNWFGVELPSKFTGFGQMIIEGLIKGLNHGFDKLQSKWQEINNYMPDWMRKKMDIHSPSRVMAGLGHFIMQGINVGLDQGFPSLKNKFNTVLDLFQGNAPQVDLKSRFSNALSHMVQSNTPREVFDPIASIQSIITKVKAVQLSPASSKTQRPIVIEGDSITVQIHAQQGHSVQDLYQQFEQFLQRREREKQAQARTRFFDDE
ncbi:phage tail protein, partial [Acinetobacter sp. ANC 5502]